MSMPCSRAMIWARGSGGLPTCQSPVPAESTSTSSSARAAAARKAASASGERQMLPRQTNRTAGLRATRSALEGALDLLEEPAAFGAFVAGLGLAEFGEQFLLPGAEPGRRLDHDL